MSATETAEPIIAVGLLENEAGVRITLHDVFEDANGGSWPAGTYEALRSGESIDIRGPRSVSSLPIWRLMPGASTFALISRVGRQFHWAEDELQQFAGGVRVECDEDGLRVINDVPLETYLSCVVCSEMAADCPLELIKAHSVISRSWLLAQRAQNQTQSKPWQENAQGLRWYDQSAHSAFDVCAEDHCQRYHGLDRISTNTVREAIAQTRGEVLTHDGKICDARYSKSCGGVVEDARAAWSDDKVPYLVTLFDGPQELSPTLDLTREEDFVRFLNEPCAAYCNCDSDNVLDLILPERDRRTTPAFFRWTARLAATQIRAWIREKRDLDIGRPLRFEPLMRAASGRLVSLRIVGGDGSIVLGKELEIRRVLSDSHLLSSAFIVEAEGRAEAPEAFVLHGAGWGHGVGLCQIGAAVMAVEGQDHRAILQHYYPGAHCTGNYARNP